MFSSTPHKIADHLVQERQRRTSFFKQKPHTVKIKTQIAIYLYWCVCRRRKAGRSERRFASRRLTWSLSLCPLCMRVSYSFGVLSLPAASAHQPSPPPSTAQVTQPWYHPAACGWLPPSIIQPDRVHVSVLCCSVLSCRVVHGQNRLKENLRAKLCSVATITAWMLLCFYCEIVCKVSFSVMWEELIAEGHMICMWLKTAMS